MTIKHYAGFNMSGLSSDTKPTTVPTNAVFFETDTGKSYQFTGGIWVIIGQCWDKDLTETITNKTIDFSQNTIIGAPGRPETRKWSAMYFVSATATTGFIPALTSATGQGSASGSVDATYGRKIQFTTGTTSGNNAGSQNSSGITCRAMNPHIKLKFSLGQTDNLFRFYFGWKDTTVTDPSGDDPLNAKSGFMVGVVTTNNTYFVVMSNDGSGATTITPTTKTLDTAIHTLEIIADEANSRWGYAFDEEAYTYITSNIPAASTNLGIGFECQTATTAAKNFQAYWFWHEQDQ